MKPDRWRQITEIFHAAVARDSSGRETFLNEACQDDPALRAEVEKLLAAHDEAGSWGTEPASVPPLSAPRFAPGNLIGSYRIDAFIDAGGMGEVYRARDLTLGRDVALKVLPDSLAHDPDRRARFEREARLLAALNHPHIATIHGLEKADGRMALVLELVEGPTLSEVISGQRHTPPGGGPPRVLKIDDALAIARQIAEALEAAHEKGIIHRDLKPANIKLAQAGGVKVLDFGLAKAFAGDQAASDVSQPTVTSGGTHPGLIVGTAAYMSPEQARGQRVDKRTDIWAFGCVLYEMLTGRQAFQGATISDTIAAILDREPDWNALPIATPPSIRRVLQRCLTKDLKRRLRDIGDVSIDLEGPVASERAAAATKPDRRPWIATVVVSTAFLATLASAALVAYFVWVRPRPAAPQASRHGALTRVTFDEGLQTQPTWSPDGRFIAYSSNQSGNFDIWVQPLGGGRAVQVTTDSATDWQPAWSPDGNSLAFRSERDGGGIFVVPALGGREQKLAPFGYWPEWSPDGSKVLVVLRPPLQAGGSRVPPHVYLLDPKSTAPMRVLEQELAQFMFVGRISWHPDGQRISFSGTKKDVTGFWTLPDRTGFWTQPIAGGPAVRAEMTEVVQRDMNAQIESFAGVRWAPAGDALYVQGVARGVRNLWKIDVDPATLRMVGGPVRLTTGPGIDAELAIASDGNKLAFVTKTETSRLWSLPFDARTRRLTGDAAPLTPPNMSVEGFDIAATGSTLAYIARRAGKTKWELWSSSLDSGQTVLLTEGLDLFGPRVSRDGTRVAYRVARDSQTGEYHLAWLTIGSGEEHPMAAGLHNAMDWSPDGNRILHSCAPPERHPTLCTSPAAATTIAESRRVLIDSDYYIWQGRYSPDGRWILFNAQSIKQADASILGVMPVAGGKWIPITEATLWADKARWAPDGKAIFFISNRDSAFFDIWGLEFDPAKGVAVGQEYRVTRFDNPGRVVSGTGLSELGVSQSRLVVPITETSGSIWVLDNVKR